ncbi:MAG: glycosyltransferase involved in cell wall biosynthesis [Planctomycetota bacterium]|jgi:glycosyltransferase involved in cell wall biosynthesis
MTRPRLRLGMVTDGWWPERGGVQTVTRELASAFIRSGHEVFTLALDRQSSAAQGSVREEWIDGVHVRRVHWRDEGQDSLDALIRCPELEEQVARWSGEFGFDLVHLHSLCSFGLGAPIRLQELNVPVVWTWHDYWPICPRGQMWHLDGVLCEGTEASVCGDCVSRTWPLLAGDGRGVIEKRQGSARAAVDACARVFFPSSAARDIAVANGYPLLKLCVCENGSDPLLDSGASNSSWRGPVLRIGLLGSVQPSKGVLEFARWIVELGKGFELHVHGDRAPYHGDASYVDALMALAESNTNLQLHGPYDHGMRGAVFRALDLIAVPSLWQESFGLVAREARRAGLPVFVSNRGGLVSEELYVLPAADGEAWKTALQRFVSDEAWRVELSRPSSTLRSSSQMAQELLAVYEEILN